MAMNEIRVQHEPFDVGMETMRLCERAGAAGGLASFLGVVRPGGGLVSLTLEHYPGMTEQQMRAIGVEAQARFGLLGCTLIHRVGRLVVGEPIVLVLAASAHRQPALDAVGFMIDWLKTRAPFWKCEEFADGHRAWVEARESDDEAAARW